MRVMMQVKILVDDTMGNVTEFAQFGKASEIPQLPPLILSRRGNEGNAEEPGGVPQGYFRCGRGYIAAKFESIEWWDELQYRLTWSIRFVSKKDAANCAAGFLETNLYTKQE